MVLARDLQAFIKFKQEQFQELIDKKFSAGLQIVQVTAKLQLLNNFVSLMKLISVSPSLIYL